VETLGIEEAEEGGRKEGRTERFGDGETLKRGEGKQTGIETLNLGHRRKKSF
jgi:hypothetical protein